MRYVLATGTHNPRTPSGFDGREAQPRIVRRPAPIRVAQNRLKQRRNLIEKSTAIFPRTRQRRAERIRESLQPSAHSGGQRRGAWNELYAPRHKPSPPQASFIVIDGREIPRDPRGSVPNTSALKRGH